MKLDNIEAILFDSGRVLNFPQMGHWFIPPNFFNYVDKFSFERIYIKKRHHAFDVAERYINSIHFIKTIEEEIEHFEKFYDIFSKELPALQLDKNNVCNLANALVNNPQNIHSLMMLLE